jgi:hypothetical protein
MNIEQLNEIQVKDFLDRIGILPAQKRAGSFWYISPIRQTEKTPSFRVNTRINRWYDYGLLEGGKLFDLAKRLYPGKDISGLIQELNSIFAFDHQIQNSFFESQPIHISVTLERRLDEIQNPVVIRETKQLGNNPAISTYLDSRGILVEVAASHCCEVYYSIGEKNYFAVGFKNRSGGYELRNPFFKGSSSPKDISLITYGSGSICILEGFMDFLSLLTLREKIPSHTDFLILNSAAMAKRSFEIVSSYQEAFLFLDHDEAGRMALEMYDSLDLPTTDCSYFYKDHKDLNAFLMDTRPEKSRLSQNQKNGPRQGV